MLVRSGLRGQRGLLRRLHRNLHLHAPMRREKLRAGRLWRHLRRLRERRQRALLRRGRTMLGQLRAPMRGQSLRGRRLRRGMWHLQRRRQLQRQGHLRPAHVELPRLLLRRRLGLRLQLRRARSGLQFHCAYARLPTRGELRQGDRHLQNRLLQLPRRLPGAGMVRRPLSHRRRPAQGSLPSS